MNIAEQHAFDFDKAERERPLMEQWEANRQAQAYQWTDEALAMQWVLGRHDKEWWDSLPSYERFRYLEAYKAEVQTFDALMQQWRERGPLCELFHPGGHSELVWPTRPRFPTVNQSLPPIDKKTIDADLELCKRWAGEIMADWMAGRPCSLRPGPQYITNVKFYLLMSGAHASIIEGVQQYDPLQSHDSH